jgi:hypothetical protein
MVRAFFAPPAVFFLHPGVVGSTPENPTNFFWVRPPVEDGQTPPSLGAAVEVENGQPRPPRVGRTV